MMGGKYWVSIVVDGGEDGKPHPVRRAVVDETEHESDAIYMANKLVKMAGFITEILDEHY
jgi:hypothetical protein